jgi:hypothetical protein
MAPTPGTLLALSSRPALVVAAASMLLTACWVIWSDAEYISAVAWSDDDARVVYAVLRYEERDSANPLHGSTIKRNFRHQLYLQKPDGSGKSALGNEIAGQNAMELYFMRDAGYVLAGAVDDSARWFNRIGLDGRVREVARKSSASCEARYFDVVPSPDGEVLALVQAAPGCSGTGWDGPPSPHGGASAADEMIFVQLLDAQTLAVLKSHAVTLQAWSIEWTWRLEGDFVVTDGRSAWSLDTDRNALATSVPACTWPKTSSSEWSAAGVHVYADGPTVRTGETQPHAAFGACH